MSKTDEFAITVKIIMVILFIILSLVASIVFCRSTKDRAPRDNSTLAFWPPDLVPHAPHFPDPNKPSNPAKVNV